MNEIQNTEENDKAINEYLNGQRDLDSLTEDQVDIAVEREFEKAEAETANVSTEQPVIEDNKTEETKDDLTASIAPADQNAKLAEALARANKAEQLYKDRESKLKSLKEDPSYRTKFFGEEIKTEIDPNKDYLDDEYLAQVDTMRKELDNLKKAQTEREARDLEFQQSNQVKQEQLGLFEEISKLQGDYPQLKTNESFQSIDSKFANWTGSATNAGVDTDKYFKDAEYRKAVDGKGYKLDISDADMDKAYKIYDVFDQYKKEKDSGYKTSLKRVLKDSPIYEKLVASKYGASELANDDALEKKIAERSTEPTILNTGNAPASNNSIDAIVVEMESLALLTAPTQKQNARYLELDNLLSSLNITG
jgi:hypothetical protein